MSNIFHSFTKLFFIEYINLIQKHYCAQKKTMFIFKYMSTLTDKICISEKQNLHRAIYEIKFILC